MRDNLKMRTMLYYTGSSADVRYFWRNKEFDGVMTDTEVLINGKLAGEMHQGGFNRFCYDITDLLTLGKKNTLEVKVAKESANSSDSPAIS